MELIIFVGIQASGKSSYYRERFADTHALVSKDLMGNTRFKDVRQEREIADAIAQGRSIVVDNTNLTPIVRAPLIAQARAAGYRVVGYFFDSVPKDSMRRNANRSGKARVPDVALYSAIKRLVRPVQAEGFDMLCIVRLTESGFETEEVAS